MAARGDLIAQFIEITGTDENVARFYLSSCDWDIEHALGNYWSTQADLPVPVPTVGHADNPQTKADFEYRSKCIGIHCWCRRSHRYLVSFGGHRTGSDQGQAKASARDAINLNSEAPSTTLQIRLADGSRLAAQFNLSHTVSDIRRFIQTARPQYSTSNFILVSSFPTRELSDDNSTIEKAGLKNAALMQRLK
ncbi:GD10253 [Drosophila simulans]|uniref:GD10253 n=1 Tax=Drosophila simulans TaxID=7240 RepID=B4QEA9_DROSI|nr:GD10253 [Drosophila simulans]